MQMLGSLTLAQLTTAHIPSPAQQAAPAEFPGGGGIGPSSAQQAAPAEYPGGGGIGFGSIH